MSQDIESKIAAMAADPKLKIRLIREPFKVKSDNWHETAHHWLVEFPSGASTDYYTGLGHREAKKSRSDAETYGNLKHKNLTDHGLESLLKASKAKTPPLKDILYSLAQDSQAVNENFSDWCANLGYDDDSMKAMEIYKACIATAGLLRGMGFNDLQALHEFFQDY